MAQKKISDEMREALAAADHFAIDHGDGNLEVCIFAPADRLTFDRKANRALNAGKRVTWSNGVTEWWTVDVIHNPTKDGSDAFIWDRSGNKVKHRITSHRQHVDGSVIKTTIGHTFRRF